MPDDLAERINRALGALLRKIDRIEAKTDAIRETAAEALSKAKTQDRLMALVIMVMVVLLAAVLDK